MTTNKTEMKRYNITTDKHYHPVPYETEHGRWVEYSSYKTLQAECEELRKDVDQYRRLIELGEDFQWENIIRVDISDFPSRADAIDAIMGEK